LSRRFRKMAREHKGGSKLERDGGKFMHLLKEGRP